MIYPSSARRDRLVDLSVAHESPRASQPRETRSCLSVLTALLCVFMLPRRTTSERAQSESGSDFSMPRCATCDTRRNVRLYEFRVGDDLEHRWWCPECSFSAQRAGTPARLSPVWVERAALRRLPTKPLSAGS